MSKKKINGMVLMTLHAALQAVDLKQFTLLFQEAVGDTGALSDDCDDLTEQRQRQFRKGIALILKARKGALKDAELFADDCDCEGVDCEVCYLRENGKRLPKNRRKSFKAKEEDCDCSKNERCHECGASKMQAAVEPNAATGVDLFSRATVNRLLALKTGMLFSQIGVSKDEMVMYSEANVQALLLNVDYLSDLRTGLLEMFGCSFKITNKDGVRPHNQVPLTRDNPRFVVTLES